MLIALKLRSTGEAGKVPMALIRAGAEPLRIVDVARLQRIPQPVRGRPNEPAHVVHTVATLAEVRGEDRVSLAARLHANAAAALRLRSCVGFS